MNIFDDLIKLARERKLKPVEGSYTNKLLNDKDKAFFDRAGQGRYSPASTIKPAIGLYGLENKIIDWEYTIDDPGFFVLPEDNRIYRGWKKGGHGNINLMDAIIESSNTFFFSLAYESEIENLIEHPTSRSRVFAWYLGHCIL